jgi:broad specificity phosphatase PhoE
MAPDLPTVALTRTPFWFMRHGETDWNRDGLIQGRTDVPLNAEGWAQAHAASGVLAGRGITAIRCSPLQRAHDTATVVGEALGVPVEVVAGLREANFGVQEGQPMGDWFTHWSSGETSPEGGEAFADLCVRAVAAMNAVLQTPGLVLVVAHGGFFRAVRAAMGMSPAVRTANGVPVFCDPAAEGWRLVTPGELPRA